MCIFTETELMLFDIIHLLGVQLMSKFDLLPSIHKTCYFHPTYPFKALYRILIVNYFILYPSLPFDPQTAAPLPLLLDPKFLTPFPSLSTWSKTSHIHRTYTFELPLHFQCFAQLSVLVHTLLKEQVSRLVAIDDVYLDLAMVVILMDEWMSC
jgi:hypothetical protein